MRDGVTRSELERGLWAEACRRKFWTFARYGFGISNWMNANPHQPWLTERMHRPLCDWFEWHVRDWLATRHKASRRRKLAVIWPRHFGKTTLITKAGQLWCHLQNADLATVTDSVTQTKSYEFMNSIRDTIEGANPYAWFPQLYGSWVGQRNWKLGSLTHNQRIANARSEASFEASSVEVGLTGKHPDAVFIDDPVTIEKLREGEAWLKLVDDHVNALIPVVPKNGLIVACATRYRDYDWIGRFIKEEGVRSLDGMQLRDPDFKLSRDGQWDLYLMRARTDLGDPVLPEVWDEQALRDYENKDPMGFAGQMMNEPGEGAHMPISWAQVEGMLIEDRELPRTMRYSLHCDAAFKSADKIASGDYSVIQVWGHEPQTGQVYFLGAKRSNVWKAEEFLDAFVATLQGLVAQRKRVFVVTYDEETGGLRGTMQMALMNACHAIGLPLPPCKPMRRNVRKDTRIRDAAMYWADGRVKILRTAPEWRQLASEMVRLGVARTRDMADAAADVFAEGVYKPETTGSSIGNYRPVRPWDEELGTPTGRWSADFVRRVADSAQVQREEKLEWPIH